MGLSNYSLVLKNDGTLWGCGRNGEGQLGLGDASHRNTFIQVTTNTNNVKSVHCGGYHTFILKNDGTLWGCGYNRYGQLGLGDTTNRTTFTQITTNANDIKSVYCGLQHTFILENDGTLWGCGYNGNGELGLGDNTNRTTFTQITTNADNIKQIYCGNGHTIILKDDGTLWGCGLNNHGQLGLGDGNSRNTFTQIITNTDDIKQIYCGYYHTIILENDGTLWGAGQNGVGQLGLGDGNDRYTFTQITTNTNNIKQVYCGDDYAFIFKNDGTLWVTGYNRYGQLGLGDTSDRYTFTQVTTNANDVKSIYGALNYTIMLKNDGTLWGCGQNNYGQLGLGDGTNRSVFTKVTTNGNDVKSLPYQYDINIIKVYDLNTGLVETLDTNNFRNIPVNKFEKIKVLYTNPDETFLNCLISFDQKRTWKTFNGTNWTTVLSITPNDVLMNGMGMKKVNELDKSKLIAGGFTGDIDFLIAMKTNDNTKTPSVTKIYIQYKK